MDGMHTDNEEANGLFETSNCKRIELSKNLKKSRKKK